MKKLCLVIALFAITSCTHAMETNMQQQQEEVAVKEQQSFRSMLVVPETDIYRDEYKEYLKTRAVWMMSLYSNGDIDIYKINQTNVILFLQYDHGVLKQAYFLFL